MKLDTITVRHTTREVPIYIGENLFGEADTLRHLLNNNSYILITNQTIASLYEQSVIEACGKSGHKGSIIIPDGEIYKNFTTYQAVLEKMFSLKTHRNDILVVVGGGVVGDLGGFCAATYMRGITYLSIPTTLLAQVDSSIGGKVAINLNAGKNIVGSFYPPQAIISSVNTLSSLADVHYYGGFAEVIKYAMTHDASTLTFLIASHEKLMARESGSLISIITWAMRIKAAIISSDEFEQGERKLLNFGHSFGHAIESLGKYQSHSHGEAVAIGMVMAACFSASFLGTITSDDIRLLKKVLALYNLPTTYQIKSAPAFLEAMRQDKKNSGTFNLILLKKIGQAYVENNVDENSLLTFLLQWDKMETHGC
ncbi:MAG: 3-dehydroquinate synthase [Methylacidiphilales bacterium]|nr:3-dehydroquinate synthase [Candidatus Methylacidiphilales bacterium]